MAAGMKRVTLKNPLRAQKAAPKDTIFRDSLIHVFAATRREAARRVQTSGKVLIPANQFQS